MQSHKWRPQGQHPERAQSDLQLQIEQKENTHVLHLANDQNPTVKNQDDGMCCSPSELRKHQHHLRARHTF